MPKLIVAGQIADDRWQRLELAAEQAPDSVSLPSGPVLVPLEVWLARKAELLQRQQKSGEPLGIWLAPGQAIDAIVPDLAQLAVIAVQFPSFADGRGYSTARLLRERHGFRGELRAFGDVGQDHLYFMRRVGFDAFVLKEPEAELSLALRAFESFPETYQSAVDQPLPLFRRRAA